MENQILSPQLHQLYCEGAEICHLISFPEHQEVPPTNSIQPRPFLSLMPGTYNATQLAYETVKDFAEGLQHEYQVLAYREFVSCYRQAAPRADAFRAWQQNAIQQGRRFPFSVQEWETALDLDNSLHYLMRCLDDCFFFGTLTRVHQGHQAPWVQLFTGYNILRDEAVAYGETESSEDPRGNPWSKIKVWTVAASESFVEALPWSFIVSTLMHEMTHAYLNTFVCNGEKCYKNHANTCGRSGHGNTFLKIHAVILQQLRSWDAALTDMDSTFSLEGGCVDAAACAHEEQEYQEARDRDNYFGWSEGKLMAGL
ncbi:hypothetical protein CcaCcLH18_00523 [Colletotrichum camelliae]|nr:hypothetical protein CcaCcLH18_00523 [Colletotrichum camelliae]